ncbi:MULTISPECIES: glycosyltransferase family 4 protein [Halorussus]|uniref:glycosyltransferase family 4 protein n=1 Tax=Halorussus TaxID=1070314 RepID=UPI000E20EA21|nr:MULTISPECIES: glycosyltransferase family 4 protein [Halorussus]NHN60105.1 glycosyltransferase family 4 protein [Halorussus sp. JP-T4]
MRILRVAQKVYPDVVGGGPYHVHALSRDQAAAGHDVTVLTVGDGPRQEEHEGYTIVRRKPTATVLGNDISVGIGRFLRMANEYDVVHAHSHLYFSTNLTALNRQLGDTPLAITNHGLYSQNAPEWLFDMYLRTLGRWTFNSADVVFCYTAEDKHRVRNFGVRTDIEVIANGIDQTRFTPDGPESDLVDADGPIVLFVGRLVEGKRPVDLLEAVAQLRSAHPDVELYICGDGPLHTELAQRAGKLDIRDAVTFLGHVSYDEMPKVYRASDVLALPSRAEGLPRTVLESLASGTPAVTSDLEQVAPIVDGVGLTVPVGDCEALANALGRLLADDQLRAQYSQEGRQRVQTGFTWSETVDRTTETLRNLIRQQ